MAKVASTILGIGFVDMISAGIMLPVVIALVPTLSSGPSIFSFVEQHQAIKTGVVLSIYPLFQAFAVPLLGMLADTHSRKYLLVLCLLGTLVANALSVAAIVNGSLMLFMVSRATDGLTGGNMTLLQSLLLEETQVGGAEKTLGRLSGVSAIGFVLGPLIGGLCMQYSAVAPFACMLLLNLIAAAAAFFIIPNRTNAHGAAAKAESLTALAFFREAPLLKELIMLNSMVFFSLSTVVAYLGTYLLLVFAISPVTLGSVFLLLGLSLGLGQMLLLPALSKRLSKQQIFVLSAAAIAAAVVPLTLGISALHILGVQLGLLCFCVAGIGMLQNIIMGAIGTASHTSPHKTSVLGVTTSCQTISDFLARLSSGFFVLWLGLTGPFIVVVLAVVLCMLLWSRLGLQASNAPKH